MGQNKKVYSILMFLIIACQIHAQNIYELRKLSDRDWLKMSNKDRLIALGTANRHAQNQTFIGDFGIFHDMYKKWGYKYYEMEDRYENYSFRNFENYNIIEENRRRWSYNEFGDRIAKMTHEGVIWKEKYKDDGQFYMEMPGSFINAMTSSGIDGVWIASETTDDWAFSAIGAGALRSKFSPLTLSLPNMIGMRLDFQSANTKAAVINSLPLEGLWLRGSSERLLQNSDLVKYGSVVLRGGTVRRKFGILTLGASYVNQYGVQGNREGGDSWYGTVNNFTPTPMMVALRFLDDSPTDNEGGPHIFDVRLKVNGKYRDDIIPRIMLDDVTLDRTTAITDVRERRYLEPVLIMASGSQPGIDLVSIGESLPKYADYFYLNDFIKGANLENVEKNYDLNLARQYFDFIEQDGRTVEVNGTETVVYWFDISTIKDHVNRVEADFKVANDYRIQTALIYTKQIAGGHDTAGKNKSHYDATYWNTVAQADGNVKDMSNLTQMTVDFGLQVANIIYGFDFDIDYRGLKIAGEYVTNSNHYMFPDDYPGTGKPMSVIGGQPPRTGYKWAQRDNAYYITGKKDWERFGFAFEIFKMGKFYRPYMDYFGLSEKYGSSINSRNNTIRIPLIEDNDDDDQYPDTMYQERNMGRRLNSSYDPDGVFPGNDEDNDGLADNNKNNNKIPDYDEPFLMFDSDPDAFVFGNDFNNNNIPDFREDDMKLDTPYELDRQGRHFNLRYTPITNINLIIGSIRTHGVGLDTRTNDDYFKFLVSYDVFDVGRIHAEYRYEKIQDNIRDPYVQVNLEMEKNLTGGRFERDLYYDELEYKNSAVNRLYIDLAIRAIPSISLENHAKFEKNNQIEGIQYDNTYQSEETINTLAMVNKITYTKRLGNWTFSPGLKYRFYKKDRSDFVRLGDYYLTRIPLLMFRYDVSSQTNIILGLQGIKGLEYHHTDYVQSENNGKQKTYCLQLQNLTNYLGYIISTNIGIKYDELEYLDNTRGFENYKSSTIFVSFNAGW